MQERERIEQREQQDVTEELTRPEGMSDEAEREQEDMRRNEPAGASGERASDDDADLSRTADARLQHGEMHRSEDEAIGRGGPSPYDEAPSGTPEDQVIEKGQSERPGPTESRGERMETD